MKPENEFAESTPTKTRDSSLCQFRAHAGRVNTGFIDVNDHVKTYFLEARAAAIVEESSGMGQSRGYDGRKSRTDTRSAAAGGAPEVIGAIG